MALAVLVQKSSFDSEVAMEPKVRQAIRIVFLVLALLIILMILFGVGIPGIALGNAGDVKTLAVAVFFLLLTVIIP